jgi:hypothetical protein
MMENIESKNVFFLPALGDVDFSFGCSGRAALLAVVWPDS